MAENIRPWQSGDTVKINGTNLMGEERVYEFKELNAEYGTMIFHQYASVVAKSWDTVQEIIGAVKDEDEAKATGLLDRGKTILKVLPEILTWNNVKALCGFMLSDHTMTENNTAYTAGESGFSEYKGDPLEMYTAIFYAVLANYPKYTLPFFEALTPGDDSTQDSEPNQD